MYGVRGIPLQWFKSYLTDRQQYVAYNGYNSCKMNISCGVPQGSILGPLLFLIFINDLHNVSEELFFVLFADDSNLLLSGPDVYELCNRLNRELIGIVNWFKINKLCLNIKKTNFMIFCAKNKNYNKDEIQLKVDSIIVEQVDQTKFLGVYIDSRLSWSSHISHVASKISKNIGIITRARKVLNKKTLTTLYYTFIYPYLNYCSTVWGSAPPTKLSKLLSLQKRIVRIISGKPKLSPSRELFTTLRILPVDLLNKFKLSIFCFKFLDGELPNIFDGFITIVSDVHTHYTRSSYLLYITPPRTNYAKHSVQYLAPFTWNSLNPELRKEKCLISFKRKTIDYLLSTL